MRAAWFLQRAILIAAVVSVFAPSARGANGQRFCSDTAVQLKTSGKSEVVDEFAKTGAVCLNESNAADRSKCISDGEAARAEGLHLVEDRYQARLEICKRVGEKRYDPSFDEQDFITSKPNPYFPLEVGNKWVFGGGEDVEIEVLNETKLIDGVTCRVIRDVVKVKGEVVEDTSDWLARDKNGTIWYCGEEVKDYESFDGDQPRKAELVAIDGSFKVDRDGSKPGTLFLASPKKGVLYREEFSVANAEDVAEILTTNYKYGTDKDLDQLVPKELADRFCSNADCVVTKAFSAMSPGVIEFKYYAKGIGQFLNVKPDSQEVVYLKSCNVGPLCATLP